MPKLLRENRNGHIVRYKRPTSISRTSNGHLVRQRTARLRETVSSARRPRSSGLNVRYVFRPPVFRLPTDWLSVMFLSIVFASQSTHILASPIIRLAKLANRTGRFAMFVSSTELHNNFGKYLMLAAREEIIITRNGTPVAKLAGFPERTEDGERFSSAEIMMEKAEKYPDSPGKATCEAFRALSRDSEERYNISTDKSFCWHRPRRRISMRSWNFPSNSTTGSGANLAGRSPPLTRSNSIARRMTASTSFSPISWSSAIWNSI